MGPFKTPGLVGRLVPRGSSQGAFREISERVFLGFSVTQRRGIREERKEKGEGENGPNLARPWRAGPELFKSLSFRGFLNSV